MSADYPAPVTGPRSVLVRLLSGCGLVILALVVLAAIPWTFCNIHAGRELTRELRAWKEAGLPLSVEEVAPTPIPDSRNAAPIYMRALEIDFDAPVVVPLSIAGLSKEQIEAIEQFVADPEAHNTPVVQAILAQPRVIAVLEELRRAAQYPECVFPVKWAERWRSPIPHMGKLRHASQLVGAQALVLAELGQVEEALNWCQVGLRMAVHADMEPGLLGQLVAQATRLQILRATERIISDRVVSSLAAKSMEHCLAAIDLKGLYERTLLMEAVLGYGFLSEMGGDPELLTLRLVGAVEDVPAELRWYASPLGNPLRRLDQAAYLKAAREQIRTGAVPYREIGPNLRTGQVESARWHPMPIAPMLLHPLGRSVFRRDTSQARMDLCRTALALKQYRAEFGHYPDSLDALQDDLGWEPPCDIFTGEPFHYSRDGAGFVIRSPGPRDRNGIPWDGYHERLLTWTASG